MSWRHTLSSYFFDAGVFRVNRPVGPLDSTSEIGGAALVGLIAQHLCAWCDYSQRKHELFYWQTRSRSAVDCVVYGESGLFAMEVKNAKRIDGTELRALNNFAEDYPEAQRFMLYRGDERFSRDGVLCMPIEEFLLGLRPGNFPSRETPRLCRDRPIRIMGSSIPESGDV